MKKEMEEALRKNTEQVTERVSREVTERVARESQLNTIQKLYLKLQDVCQVAELLDVSVEVVKEAVLEER